MPSPFAPWLSSYPRDWNPDRPWWIVTSYDWAMRTDPALHEGAEIGVTYRGPDALAALDAYDAAHPRPVPSPHAGQVWVWPDGEERIVTHVWPGGRALLGSGLHLQSDEWPPAGAVLVSGPGAPWAPKGWRCPE